MQLFNPVALVLVVGKPCFFASASYETIAGYAPGSRVTSHNAIDLDQKRLEDILGQAGWAPADVQAIYENGGNSKTYAEFSVNALSGAVSKSDAVVGATSKAAGKMYSSYAKGATTIKVAYSTSDVQSTYVNCKGGALTAKQGATAAEPYILSSGCFAQETLTITTNAGTVSAVATGAPTNKAGRTLKGFSTKAGDTMYNKGANGGCKGASDRATDGCPYKDFSEYYNYYGSFDYAHKFVMAAINGGSTSFGKAQGDMDFTSKSKELRKECIKKGTAYMNAWMYAIREFEDAVDDCKAGCPGGKGDKVSGKDCNSLSVAAVHAWDEGVAFYTGSLEGKAAGGNSAGKLSYRLAEKRCGNFKTCGATGDALTGTSYVNTELFKQFDVGKTNLQTGKCDDTKKIVRKVVSLMSIPLIQGTLRYAYKVGTLNEGDKSKGEGAVFAAAIVPRVFACSATDGATIMNNMKVGASGTTFASVKTAFEKNYKCLGVTCAEIGGLWQSSQGKYYDGASPCSGEFASAAAPHAGVVAVAKAIIVITMTLWCHGH